MGSSAPIDTAPATRPYRAGNLYEGPRLFTAHAVGAYLYGMDQDLDNGAIKTVKVAVATGVQFPAR